MKRISIFILIAALTVVFTESGAFALSRLGSSGGEVSNIQSRLKEWGYYNGAVDGVYGQGTADAVKRFQQKNGLTADGVAGAATLAKIGLPTGQSAAGNTSSNDVTLLAMVINGEARGEPYEGQVAVVYRGRRRTDQRACPTVVLQRRARRAERLGSDRRRDLLFQSRNSYKQMDLVASTHHGHRKT